MSEITIIKGKTTEEPPMSEAEKNTMLIRYTTRKILTDIRDYLVKKAELIRERDMEFLGQSAMLQLLAIEHKELTEYAEKLGVEL